MDWDLVGKAATAIAALLAAGFAIKLVVNWRTSNSASSRKTSVKQSGNFAGGDIVGGDKVTTQTSASGNARSSSSPKGGDSAEKP